MYPGRHHHRSGEEEEEEGRQGEGRSFPAPGYQPYRPQPYGAGDEERNRGPPPPPHHHGGPDYGYGGESYQRYNPPVTHGPGYGSGPGRPAVQHVAHEMGPGPYPRPFPPAIHDSGFDSGSNFPSVQHVAHDQRPHPPAIRESRYDTGPGFPAVQHVAHETGPGSYQRPHPPAPHGAGYDSGPSFPAVQHVAHDVRPGPYKREEEGGRRRQETRDPHIHSFVRHVSHENRRTVRVFTKAEENYSLSIRDGKVILARADPNDEFQHWIKDEKYSTRVKDEEGFPCFALINKVTGEVIKHSIGATHPVRLIPYNPDFLDESILWTESRDTGEGFRCIRMVNNIRLNFDAFHGDKDHGGVRDGTTVVLWEWVKGKNQRWKIVPY